MDCTGSSYRTTCLVPVAGAGSSPFAAFFLTGVPGGWAVGVASRWS